MEPPSGLLSALIAEALDIAQGCVVGELEPRLIPNASGQPLHIMTVGELHGGTSQLARRPCLLVDVGLPGEYVRLAIHQDDEGRLALAALELWSPRALSEGRREPLPLGYTSLFDALRAQLNAAPVG